MKVAIVTGASRGIGRACALRLARDGYTVVINYAHREDEARAVLDAIEAAGGAGMLCQADVSDPAAVRAMMRDVSKAYGQIDLLVNNAGIVRDEYLLMLTPETLDQCLDLNVKGYLYCAQQAVLKMFRKKSGAIINMSSVSGTFALAGQTLTQALIPPEVVLVSITRNERLLIPRGGTVLLPGDRVLCLARDEGLRQLMRDWKLEEKR